jgi:hypothetical protein
MNDRPRYSRTLKSSSYSIWYNNTAVGITINAVGDALTVSWHECFEDGTHSPDTPWSELNDDQKLTVLKTVWRHA